MLWSCLVFLLVCKGLFGMNSHQDDDFTDLYWPKKLWTNIMLTASFNFHRLGFADLLSQGILYLAAPKEVRRRCQFFRSFCCVACLHWLRDGLMWSVCDFFPWSRGPARLDASRPVYLDNCWLKDELQAMIKAFRPAWAALGLLCFTNEAGRTAARTICSAVSGQLEWQVLAGDQCWQLCYCFALHFQMCWSLLEVPQVWDETWKPVLFASLLRRSRFCHVRRRAESQVI